MTHLHSCDIYYAILDFIVFACSNTMANWFTPWSECAQWPVMARRALAKTLSIRLGRRLNDVSLSASLASHIYAVILPQYQIMSTMDAFTAHTLTVLGRWPNYSSPNLGVSSGFRAMAASIASTSYSGGGLCYKSLQLFLVCCHWAYWRLLNTVRCLRQRLAALRNCLMET